MWLLRLLLGMGLCQVPARAGQDVAEVLPVQDDAAGRDHAPFVTTKTREAADRDARADGIEPLALILERMRAEYAARNYDKAAALAVSVLPYRHPRLGQIMPGPADDAPLTDERRLALLVVLLERLGQGGPRPPALPGLPASMAAAPRPAGGPPSPSEAGGRQ
jgi:hypothetical protein